MQASIERVIDRLNLRWLLAAYAAWITAFAFIYWVIPRFDSSMGPALQNGDIVTTFNGALLFSFATATNSGVGEMVPAGIAQLVAAIEILGGIVFAGLAINLLAVMPSKKTRIAEKACRGWWLEQVTIPRVGRFYSVTFIARNGDVLRKNGYNFDPLGGNMDKTTFQGQVLTAYFPILISQYKNDPLSEEYTDGYLQFEMELGPGGKFNSYRGLCYDKKHGGRDRIIGRRISDPDIVKLLNERGDLTGEQHHTLVASLFSA